MNHIFEYGFKPVALWVKCQFCVWIAFFAVFTVHGGELFKQRIHSGLFSLAGNVLHGLARFGSDNQNQVFLPVIQVIRFASFDRLFGEINGFKFVDNRVNKSSESTFPVSSVASDCQCMNDKARDKGSQQAADKGAENDGMPISFHVSLILEPSGCLALGKKTKENRSSQGKSRK